MAASTVPSLVMGWLRYMWTWLRWRHVELPPGHYELRYCYSPHTPLRQAEVLARADDVRDLADRFAECSAPFKQVIFAYDDGTADWLDELENQVLVEACAKRGLVLEEVEG